MLAPFGPDDMERWSALDLDDRALYDLMLDEMHVAGWDSPDGGLAAMTLELLEFAVCGFLDRYDHSRTAELVCTAMLVTWHHVHPDVSWLAHSRQRTLT